MISPTDSPITDAASAAVLPSQCCWRIIENTASRFTLVTLMAAHFRAILNTGTVEKKLKELVAVRVSHLNLCDY